MTNYVKRLQGRGIHGRFEIDLNFREQVNLIYGKNSMGKTTLLHIIANILNGDYERLNFITFDQICLELSQGQEILFIKHEDKIQVKVSVNGLEKSKQSIDNIPDSEQLLADLDRQLNRILIKLQDLKLQDRGSLEKEDRDMLKGSLISSSAKQMANAAPRREIILSTAYFPAFRTMIESWSIKDDKVSAVAKKQQQQKMKIAREILGDFIPWFDYLSLSEIVSTLKVQIEKAVSFVAQTDREYLMQTSNSILNGLAKKQDYAMDDMERLLKRIDILAKDLAQHPIKSGLISDLRTPVEAVQRTQQNEQVAGVVLEVYCQALEQMIRVQTETFAAIEQYLEAVNFFLEDKQIKIDEKLGLKLEFNDQTADTDQISQALSSGEWQILTLLYAATQMGQKEVILIDEPEISLHVDWQRSLVRQMTKQLGQRQLIICTHSPVIGADLEDDEIIMLEPSLKKKPYPVPKKVNGTNKAVA